MKTPTNRNSPRINPDSKVTLWLTVILIGSLGLTSFMVSFNGLRDVAAWVGLPLWMRWAVPVFIDIAILAYSLAAVIHKSRGESVRTTWITLGVFTATSVVANAAHALSVGQGETVVQRTIGAVIAALAPIAVFAATEELSRLAFAYSSSAAEREPTATVPSGTLEPVSETEPEETVPQAPLQVPARLQPELPKPEIESVVPVVAPVTTEPVRVTTESPAEETEVLVGATEQSAQLNQNSVGGGEDEALATWVREQIQAGNKLTGSAAGNFLGLSSRTGRNRLNKLRETSPEVFEGENS